MRAAVLFTALCLGTIGFACAGDMPPAPLPASADGTIGKACTAPVFRQFDFWLGRWTVTNPAGVVVGHSRITRISRGCAIHEQWLGRATTGNSLNYYDHGSRQWHQDWVGGGGQVLHLHGGRKGTSMVLEGTRHDARGKVIDRISWTPLAAHRVRQHWQISRDGGVTWQTIFMGTYASQGSPDTH